LLEVAQGKFEATFRGTDDPNDIPFLLEQAEANDFYLHPGAVNGAGGWPGWLVIPLAMLGGFAGGAFWGAIPGALKAYFGVNEILSTIMMNAIAIQITTNIAELYVSERLI